MGCCCSKRKKKSRLDYLIEAYFEQKEREENKVHQPTNQHLWTDDLLEIVGNYDEIMKSLAVDDSVDESLPTTGKEDGFEPFREYVYTQTTSRKAEPLVFDEYSSTVAMFWSL